jgi:F-type H+-transporting ATPase subunit delta
MAAKKQTLQLARQLFKLSFENGQITAERVAGVLGYVEKIQPPQIVAVLKAYQRLIATELGRGQAIVEHAGAVSPAVLQAIAAQLTKKYARPVTTTAKANPALLAGLRVRIGDDIYENSVSSQLGALAEAV